MPRLGNYIGTRFPDIGKYPYIFTFVLDTKGAGFGGIVVFENVKTVKPPTFISVPGKKNRGICRLHVPVSCIVSAGSKVNRVHAAFFRIPVPLSYDRCARVK
jgi:hypothetical protein